MPNPHNLAVGQSIFVVPRPSRWQKQSPFWAKVTKVGRVWFEANPDSEDVPQLYSRFSLESLIAESNAFTAYLSQEAYEAKQKREAQTQQIFKFFAAGRRAFNELSDADIEAIAAIVTKASG